MSRAFIRDNDDQLLSDVGPSLKALGFFLARDNNGIGVYEVKSFIGTEGNEIHVMSNGLSYFKDPASRWHVII